MSVMSATPELEGLTVEASEAEDSSCEVSERTSLLINRDSGSTVYASDGETNQSPVVSTGDDSEPEVEYAGGDGPGEGARRRPAAQGESGEADSRGDRDNTCGLVECGRRFLSLLPEIGKGDEDSEEFDAALKYGAEQIVQLIVPVTVCMVIVVIFELTVAVVDPTVYGTQFYLIPETQANGNSGLLLLIAVANALIFVVLVVVMTVILVLLFKYRCYKAIKVWLILASALLLFVIAGVVFTNILTVHNFVIDWFSFSFFLWNFGVMGLVVIHWKGPLRLQQAYLIVTSALVATVFLKYLPDWTTWILLFAISLYDLVAVLCPKGPLRILVETAKERNEPIFPSLIYSSTMVWVIGMADQEDKKPDKTKLPKRRPHRDQDTQETSIAVGEVSVRRAAAEGLNQPDSPGPDDPAQDDDDEPRGFKLGLGDFIFYSILVGKAAHDSSGDWVIISSCFVAILIGLCLTTLILGVVRRALPALPISIFFGLIFYFASRYLIAPFAAVLATTQTFI